ncbi:MAG: type II toxin-antitoxin system RelE/ParE family toxin [Thermodesulfobacteriota bacterium]
MAEIEWTTEAEMWLKDIHDYIALDNPTAAYRVLMEIREKVQLLKEFPDMGFIYSSEPEGNIRILLYGHYRIAYIHFNDTVYILGIFHGALDIEKYI